MEGTASLSVGSSSTPASVDPKKALENLYRSLRQQSSITKPQGAKSTPNKASQPTPAGKKESAAKAIRKMESFPGDLRPFDLLARCCWVSFHPIYV